MSWRKEQRRAERGYHHGNLKEALLQAALGLIAEKGPAGFTFADAARSAGVSPAAPYRHFRDREELLSSIAQRGFEQFEALLTQAWDDGRPDTVTAFERLGKAYLAFARNAASDVLTKGDKDSSQPWENPETGARGSVTPLAQAYSSDGRTCRDFLASYVNGRSESWLQGEACQSGQGRWEIHTLKPWKQS